MLLLIILLDAEDLAVAILILQDVGVLLTLQPTVLQIEQKWLVGAALEQAFHPLTIFDTASVRE